MSWDGLKEYLAGPHCAEAVEAYVEQRLRLRYQNLPQTDDLQALLWQLWQQPTGPRLPLDEVRGQWGLCQGAGWGLPDPLAPPGELQCQRPRAQHALCALLPLSPSPGQVFLGSRTLEYVMRGQLGEEMEPRAGGMVPWSHTYRAIKHGILQLKVAARAVWEGAWVHACMHADEARWLRGSLLHAPCPPLACLWRSLPSWLRLPPRPPLPRLPVQQEDEGVWEWLRNVDILSTNGKAQVRCVAGGMQGCTHAEACRSWHRPRSTPGR